MMSSATNDAAKSGPGYNAKRSHRLRSRLGLLAVLPLASLLMAPRCFSTTHRPISVLPTYHGTIDGKGDCTPVPNPADPTTDLNEYHMIGYEPVPTAESPGPFPLFVYLVGTTVPNSDPGPYPEDPADPADPDPIPVDPARERDVLFNRGTPNVIAEEMAARGFIAVSVGYDSSNAARAYGETPAGADRRDQLRCLFDRTIPTSFISRACTQLNNVDCDRGIAVWGHSLGGVLALKAGNYESRVRAAIGVGVEPQTSLPIALDPTRRRVINHSLLDVGYTPALISQVAAAYPAQGHCPVTSPQKQCLRADGSGWVLVQWDAPNIPWGHCWFMKDCVARDYRPALGFKTPGTATPEIPWSLDANADWLQSRLSRP